MTGAWRWVVVDPGYLPAAAVAIAGWVRIEQEAGGTAGTALRRRPAVPDPRWSGELHAVMPLSPWRGAVGDARKRPRRGDTAMGSEGGRVIGRWLGAVWRWAVDGEELGPATARHGLGRNGFWDRHGAVGGRRLSDAEKEELVVSSSSFQAGISTLRRNGLVDVDDWGLRASAMLVGEG